MGTGAATQGSMGTGKATIQGSMGTGAATQGSMGTGAGN
jgi:hypothetical protein